MKNRNHYNKTRIIHKKSNFLAIHYLCLFEARLESLFFVCQTERPMFRLHAGEGRCHSAKNSVRLRLLRVDDANQLRHQQGMCDLSLCGCCRRDWGRRGRKVILL